MANVSRVFGSWVGPDFAPDERHYWSAWGFGYGDAVSVSAHPVTGAPVGERILIVEDVRMEGDPSGDRRCYFTVRNAGASHMPGYGVGVAWVSD
jgi:hypothetical protein